MRPVLLAALFAVPALAADLKPLSYSDIGKAVRSHRGKPVLVYFWGST